MRSSSSHALAILQARRHSRAAAPRQRPLLRSSSGSGDAETSLPPAEQRKATQLERFAGFVAAGDAKEAWLCISASVLRLALPSAVLATALHGSLWGGSPPAAAAAAEAAAWGGTVVAAGTEVWKILEGFRG
ncbi:hypothetical protein ABPG75_003389 [Micractinium tetrahymenae]